METIYLADDEKNIRELMNAFLTQEGFSVRVFSDGDSLLAACAQKMPDLVILDIMMPGTDGLSVCSQLRQKDADLPIMIVSARDSPYDRVTGLTLGGDDYLIKPFLPLELVARIRALLRRSKRNTPLCRRGIAFRAEIRLSVAFSRPAQRNASRRTPFFDPD